MSSSANSVRANAAGNGPRSAATSANAAGVDPEYEQLRGVYTLFLPLMRCAPLFYLGLAPDDIDLVYSKKALINLLTELSQCFEMVFDKTAIVTDIDMMNYSKLMAAIAAEGQIEFQNFLSVKERAEPEEVAEENSADNLVGGQRGGGLSIGEMLNQQFKARSKKQRGGGSGNGPNASNALAAPSAAAAAGSAVVPHRTPAAPLALGPLSAVANALAKASRAPDVATQALQLALPGMEASQVASFTAARAGITRSTGKAIEGMAIEQDALIQIMSACGIAGDLYSALLNPNDRENKKSRQTFIQQLINQGRAAFLKQTLPALTFVNKSGAETAISISQIMSQIRDVDPGLIERLRDEDGTGIALVTFATLRTYDTEGGRFSSGQPLWVNIGGILVASAAAYQLFNSINFTVPPPIRSVHEGRWFVYERGQKTLFVPEGRVPVINPGVTVYYNGLEIQRRRRGAANVRAGGRANTMVEWLGGRETLTERERLAKNAFVDILGRSITDNNKALQTPGLSASDVTFLTAENKVLTYEREVLESDGLLAAQIAPLTPLNTDRATIENITKGYQTLGRPVTANNTYIEMVCTQVTTASSITTYWDTVTEECTAVTRTIPPPPATVSPPALTLFNVGEGEIRILDPTKEFICKLGQRYDQMSMQCTTEPAVGTLIFDPNTNSLVPSPFLPSFLLGWVPEAHCASFSSLSARYSLTGLYAGAATTAGASVATSYGIPVAGMASYAIPAATFGAPALLGTYEMATQCVPYYMSQMQSGPNVWLGAGSLALTVITLISSLRASFKYSRVSKRVQRASSALKVVKDRLDESIETFIVKIVLKNITDIYKHIESKSGIESVISQLINLASDPAITSAGAIGKKRSAIVAVFNKWKAENPSAPEANFAKFIDTLSAERQNPDGSFKAAFRPDQWSWLQTIFDPRNKIFGREKTLKEWLCDSIMKAVIQKIISDLQEQIAKTVLRTAKEGVVKSQAVVAGLLHDRVAHEGLSERIKAAEKVADEEESIEHIRAFFALRELEKNQEVVDFLSSMIAEATATTADEAKRAADKGLVAKLKLIKEMGTNIFSSAENVKSAFHTILFPAGPTNATAEVPAAAAAAAASNAAGGAGVGPLPTAPRPPATAAAAAASARNNAPLLPPQPMPRFVPRAIGFPQSAAGSSAASGGLLLANRPASSSVNSSASRAFLAANPPQREGVVEDGIERKGGEPPAAASASNALVVLPGEGGHGGYRQLKRRSTRHQQVRKTRSNVQLRHRTRKVRKQRSTRSRKH